jgi:CubicO group peptidase (beta-lactamase class C family)
MEAVLTVRGPRAQAGAVLGKLRSESVAPLVSALLGIAPPANATGVSPIRDVDAALQHRVDVVKRAAGIVVATLDVNGTTVTNRGVAADAMFEIGSITKTFTALLLCDMAERGELALTDPISKYLPEGVKAPSRAGKQITLQDLAMHISGLPRLPSNMAPANYSNPYADYDAKKLYEFLSSYELDRDIGSKWDYSNVGAGLLGHLLSLRSGMPYEQLLRTRILEPLGMKNTTITLSAEQKGRMAEGHNMALQPAGGWDLDALAGAGAIRSTAADMLKYLAAHMELTPSPLQAAMRRMRSVRHPVSPQMDMAIGWLIDKRFGNEIVWHNGGTGGYRSWAGFDPVAKRAVVVLTNTAFGADDLGRHILDARYPLDKVTPLQQ